MNEKERHKQEAVWQIENQIKSAGVISEKHMNVFEKSRKNWENVIYKTKWGAGY